MSSSVRRSYRSQTSTGSGASFDSMGVSGIGSGGGSSLTKKLDTLLSSSSSSHYANVFSVSECLNASLAPDEEENNDDDEEEEEGLSGEKEEGVSGRSSSHLQSLLQRGRLQNQLQSSSSSSRTQQQQMQVEEGQAAIQAKMAELALQLQMETQKCHDDIERIGMDVRAILPRCEADVVRLTVGLSGMKHDADVLLRDSAPFVTTVHAASTQTSSAAGGDKGVDNNKEATPPPLEILSTLHALRTNLSLTKSILSAASSWDATVSRIPSLLSPLATTTTAADGSSDTTTTAASTATVIANLTEATQSLLILENGARALRGMPGRTDRDNVIADVRRRIERLLRPRLLSALHASTSSDHALETGGASGPLLQQMASMYKSLGNMDGFTDEYVKARPAPLHRMWFAYKPPTAKQTQAAAAAAAGLVDPTTGTATTMKDDDEEWLKTAEDEEKELQAKKQLEEEAKAKQPQAEEELGVPFVEWLPDWYEAILTLLSEERRRSSTVFGNDAAPEMIARVMRECFQPILSSFTTRLSTLFPTDGETAVAMQMQMGIILDPTNLSGTTPTSFEAVCASYESTIRFLSLAYDMMLGAPATLIKSIFSQVASPFAPYQKNFAMLELKHSSALASRSRLAVEMTSGGAVGGVYREVKGGADLTALQGFVDRLCEGSNVIFPLADASLARFELLNCGYRTPAALHTADQLITNHLALLSFTIANLSSALTDPTADTTTSSSSTFSNTIEGLSKHFDEQHVHCALEVLKMAGAFVRSLTAFEKRTRDRLKSLCTGMKASIAHEAVAGEADSLSIIEVRALLAREVCEQHQEQQQQHQQQLQQQQDGGLLSPAMHASSEKVSAITQLQRICGDSRGGPGTVGGASATFRTAASHLPDLFPQSLEATLQLAGTCHAFVFEVLYSVPKLWLSSVSSLPVWREGSAEEGAAPPLDSYSILPQQYITQVGEHILALVQALEPFASNAEALELASSVMDGVEAVAEKPWRDLCAATGCSEAMNDNVVYALMKGKEVQMYLMGKGDAFELGQSGSHGEEEEEEEEDPSAKFCNEWLSVVASAVTGCIMERIVRIAVLRTKGAGHLAADLNYLVNVFSALGISGHPHPLLHHFGKLISMDGAELRQWLDTRTEDTSDLFRTISAMEIRIANMKGVGVM